MADLPLFPANSARKFVPTPAKDPIDRQRPDPESFVDSFKTDIGEFDRGFT